MNLDALSGQVRGLTGGMGGVVAAMGLAATLTLIAAHPAAAQGLDDFMGIAIGDAADAPQAEDDVTGDAPPVGHPDLQGENPAGELGEARAEVERIGERLEALESMEHHLGDLEQRLDVTADDLQDSRNGSNDLEARLSSLEAAVEDYASTTAARIAALTERLAPETGETAEGSEADASEASETDEVTESEADAAPESEAAEDETGSDEDPVMPGLPGAAPDDLASEPTEQREEA